MENFSFVVIGKDGKQEKKEKKERGQTCGITVVDGVQLDYMILIIDSYIVPLYRYESVFPDSTQYVLWMKYIAVID